MPHIRTRRRLPALTLLALAGAMLAAHAAHAFTSITVAKLATSIAGRAFEGTLLESEEGRFSVRIPVGFSSPEESTVPLETAVGKLDMKVFTAVKGAGAVIMAAYIDYPEEAFAAGTEKMLDGARDGALKNLNGKLSSQKSITLLGHPGRSITFSGTSAGTKLFGRVDYFIVKPRLYQLLYISQKKADVGTTAIKNAFSSFTLTNQE